MSDRQFRYSSYFKLYGKQNLQVSFTVQEDSQEEHLQNLNTLINDLLHQGYRIEPEGLEQGEVIREADSWVLGQTSKGENCVHLYKFPMKYKVATVYLDAFNKLPFQVPSNIQPFIGGIPERENAERMKILRPVPGFQIVLAPTGAVDEKGRPKLKFDRVFGDAKSAPDNGTTVPKMDEVEQLSFETLENYGDIANYIDNEAAKKFIKAARAQQAKSVTAADFADAAELISRLEDIYGEQGYTEVALCVIAGLKDFEALNDKLSAEVVASLMKSIDKPSIQKMTNYITDFARKLVDSQ